MRTKPKTLAAPKAVITSSEHPLLSAEEVAGLLGIPRRTLDVWRSERRGIDYYKVGKYVRYRLEDVNAYLEQQARPVDVRM